MNTGFDEIVAKFTPEIGELAVQTRELIRSVMPDVVEVAWPKQDAIGFGVGPKKGSEHFCFIYVNKSYVNLGFNYGTELPDPEKLLKGTGNLFRHVKITKSEDLSNPALRQLLVVASTHRMPMKKPK